jgi:predicted flap endonuclease-1-like 5' DNA nuclease
VTPGRLEDLTAIPGVGPVTAQKLHSLGLYTYDDLRERYDHLEELDVGPHQANKIRAWLDQRPA